MVRRLEGGVLAFGFGLLPDVSNVARFELVALGVSIGVLRC